MPTNPVVDNVLRTLDLLDPEHQLARHCHALEDDRGVLHRHHRDPMMLLLLSVEHHQHSPAALDNAQPVIVDIDTIRDRICCGACMATEDGILLSLVEAEFGEAAYALSTAKRLAATQLNAEGVLQSAGQIGIDTVVDLWLRLVDLLNTEADGLFTPTRRDWELIIEAAVSDARANLSRLHRELFSQPAIEAQLRQIAAALTTGETRSDELMADDLLADDAEIACFVADALSTHDGWHANPAEIASDWPTFTTLRNLTVAYAPQTVDHVTVSEVPGWVATAIQHCDPDRLRSQVHRALTPTERETAAKLFIPYGRGDLYNSYDTCVETARALVH